MKTRMTQLLNRISRLKAIVIGDVVLERHVWGKVGGNSLDTSMSAEYAERQEIRLGGAGSVACNIRALGAAVSVVGFVGADDNGALCRALLDAAGIEHGGLVEIADRPTVVKTRVAAGVEPATAAVPRVRDVLEEDAQRLLKAFKSAAADAALVCVAGYAEGALPGATATSVVEFCRERGIACVVGPAPNVDLAGYTGTDETVVGVAGAVLAARGSPNDATRLANAAASLSPGHFGERRISVEELIARATGGSETVARKVVLLERFLEIVKEARRSGKTIVFTNGCFDILHPGHITLMEFCRSQGDVVVVGVNSDASVKRLKGDDRPVLNEDERAHCLAALEMVDFVVLFAEDTPELMIRKIRPEVMVKGGDWSNKFLAGADFIRSYGGRVAFVPLMKGISTTAILERIAVDYQGE